ncbi:hypothetical protein BsWGS_21476 [Bradybaena similaris]
MTVNIFVENVSCTISHLQDRNSTMRIACILSLLSATSAYYPGETKMQRLSAVTTDFSQILHQKLLLLGVNSVFSGPSIHSGLSIMALGAGGTTLKEMYDAAQLTRFTGGKYKPHQAYSNVFQGYKNNTVAANVTYATYISVNSKTPVVKMFNDSASSYYLSQVVYHNLADPLGPEQKINDYFKIKTAGRIQDIVKSGTIDSSTQIVLVSAFHISTPWLEPFDQTKTKKDSFTPTQGPQIQLDMMIGNYREVKYIRNFHDADVVALPFKGRRHSLIVLLPRRRSTMAVQEKSLTEPRRVKELFQSLDEEETVNAYISMPKFQIQSTYDLSSVLQSMGMVESFDPEKADFTALSKTGAAYLSKHIHKVVFGVDEAGAAAAPVAAPRSSSFPGYPLIQLNRPFIMLLRDNLRNIIALQGKFCGK